MVKAVPAATYRNFFFEGTLYLIDYRPVVTNIQVLKSIQNYILVIRSAHGTTTQNGNQPKKI